MNFDKFLITSGMLFVILLVIIVWLLVAGQYLLVSGVTYSVILLLISYLQLLNSRIVYDSFNQAKTCILSLFLGIVGYTLNRLLMGVNAQIVDLYARYSNNNQFIV